MPSAKWLEAAEIILREDAKFNGNFGGMTNQQLFERIRERNLVQLVGSTPINTMNARLNLDIKRNGNSIFVKPVQGVFALKEYVKLAKSKAKMEASLENLTSPSKSSGSSPTTPDPAHSKSVSSRYASKVGKRRSSIVSSSSFRRSRSVRKSFAKLWHEGSMSPPRPLSRAGRQSISKLPSDEEFEGEYDLESFDNDLSDTMGVSESADDSAEDTEDEINHAKCSEEDKENYKVITSKATQSIHAFESSSFSQHQSRSLAQASYEDDEGETEQEEDEEDEGAEEESEDITGPSSMKIDAKSYLDSPSRSLAQPFAENGKVRERRASVGEHIRSSLSNMSVACRRDDSTTSSSTSSPCTSSTTSPTLSRVRMEEPNISLPSITSWHNAGSSVSYLPTTVSSLSTYPQNRVHSSHIDPPCSTSHPSLTNRVSTQTPTSRVFSPEVPTAARFISSTPIVSNSQTSFLALLQVCSDMYNQENSQTSFPGTRSFLITSSTGIHRPRLVSNSDSAATQLFRPYTMPGTV